MSLGSLRAHLDQWGGLNADDARELLNLAEAAGVHTEHAIQTYNDPMRDDMPATEMTFEVNPEDADWTRLVGPWRPA